MEEVQRMGECGETIAIERAWEMMDEAVKWLMRERNYVQVREKRGSGAMSSHFDDADAGEYVLLVQVQRDFESVKKACLAGKEVIVVARSSVDGGGGACHELLDSLGYLECSTTEHTGSNDDDDDDLRYYYHAVECRLTLDTATDPLLRTAEGHRSGEGDEWKTCLTNVMDTSKLADHEQLSVTGTAGDGAAVKQTPIIRWVVDALARTDEFHLDLKLKVASLTVGVSKREFQATDTCLGFYPDKICLSLEPSWAEMSEAIFENVPSTNISSSSTCKRTQNTEVGMGVGWGPVKVSARQAWGKEQTGPVSDIELDHTDYYTEEGGVASFVWRICKWANRKLYKSDHNLPLSPSLISRKLPKLPFKGTCPPLRDFAAATWRLPLTMMQQDLSFKLRLCFQMRFIAIKGSDAFAFLKSLKHKTVELERDFMFKIQLPTTLTSTASSAPSK